MEKDFKNSPLFKQLLESPKPKIYAKVIQHALRRNPKSTFWIDALQYIEENEPVEPRKERNVYNNKIKMRQ